MSPPALLSASVGHWTGDGTGVTVILPPPGTVASAEVRGGAPASRETALLDPTRMVTRTDAVVLSGGSAFGLSAADGVAALLRERGTGLATPYGPVPIVVGLSLFDASVRSGPPDAAAGRRAALAALDGAALTTGRVGAGAGATTGHWRGRADPGGLGVAQRTAGGATVAVLAVVNSWGDVLGDDARPLTGGPPVAGPPVPGPAARPFGAPGLNTTLAVVLTDARLAKPDCFLLAQSGNTGLARALHPAHSRFDGDAVVSLATGVADADLDLLRAAATEATAEAIRNAVRGPHEPPVR
ncbi:P1 family peptidase [Mangrovihabitans endophyticus]|uniref:Peptidase S58 n=1 Tax=Mangrovihabitans endophyticus TaxID=1751298 RepID=A0A8J3C514_9ACTN|nr:P1 family peptidase [Mangrovihabitans endophyticus]GGL19579.1 peptidase S58 [Mangrovihabitans endophyticus]